MSPTFDRLEKVMRERGVAPRGVIHVGANTGQEIPLYKEIGFKQIVAIEANPAVAAKIPMEGVLVVIGAVSNSESNCARLWLTEDNSRSSLFEPNDESTPFLDVINYRLRDLQTAFPKANVLVVDVQGAEASVLESADLNQFSIVITEINDNWRYRDAPDRNEAKKVLESAGFRQLFYDSHGDNDFGDALFVNENV